jgi:IclR family acetate operon transcriptional repressor
MAWAVDVGGPMVAQQTDDAPMTEPVTQTDGRGRRGRPPKSGAARHARCGPYGSGEGTDDAEAGRDRGARDYSIAVLDRALDVLEALAQGTGPLGATEVARRVGTTKSAAFRILSNLERRGYVGKDPETTKYRLGSRLAYLGERSLGTIDLRRVAGHGLETLHRRFEETVNLGVLDGREVVYVDMVESRHGLRMAARVGARDVAHATALGKAMLAFLPPERRRRLLRAPLARRTERTITDPAALAGELDRVRARGVAEDRGENETGARCLGAPIFDHAGLPIAAISVSAPESRLDDDRAAEVAATLGAVAAEVTRLVGGRPPDPVGPGAEGMATAVRR